MALSKPIKSSYWTWAHFALNLHQWGRSGGALVTSGSSTTLSSATRGPHSGGPFNYDSNWEELLDQSRRRSIRFDQSHNSQESMLGTVRSSEAWEGTEATLTKLRIFFDNFEQSEQKTNGFFARFPTTERNKTTATILQCAQPEKNN